MWKMRAANKERLKALVFEAKEVVKEVIKEEVVEAVVEEVVAVVEKNAKSQRGKKKEEQV